MSDVETSADALEMSISYLDDGEANECALQLRALAAERDALQKQVEWMRAAHVFLAAEEAFVSMPDRHNPFFACASAEIDASGTPCLSLNMGDTFMYACADFEPFRYEDAPELLRIGLDEGWPGLVRWTQKQREERGEPVEPIEPVAQKMLDMDALRERETQLSTALHVGTSYMAYHREKFNPTATGITPALLQLAKALKALDKQL